MKQLNYFLALVGCILMFGGTTAFVHAQHTTPTVDGIIGGSEYGDHADGQNARASGGQTWYMTWDDANLYVGLANANLGEGAILYIDRNPITPANGGGNGDGSLAGQAYDGTNFSMLPFRADFVAYFKDGYREYRAADGAGGWGSATAGFGSYASLGSGNVRELSIPWSAITGSGRPAAFNFFAYVTSGGGSVYGQVPTENASGNIGTSATYRQYYKVRNTGNGTSTKPFSVNSSDASVGGAGATYATLKAAFDAINNGTLKGNVSLYVVGSTTESAAVTLCASGFNWNGSSCVAGSSSYSSVLIQPSGGSWTISANLNGALIYLNGARNVTIDGRQGGMGTTKSLVIDNSNTGSNASALHLANNASFNTVRYVTLQGASANNDRGVIFFGADSTASGTGNDNNTIDNCDIRNSDGGLPVFAILSAGSSSPKENSENTISNNNISNWYRSIGGSYGINLSSNTTGWTISGNSLYQTASRAVGGVFTALYVNSGSGHVISGNCIGGQAPSCGGDPLPLTGNVLFQGVRLAVGNSPATSVQGNTIRNISVASSLSNDLHAAIGLYGGSFNIGDGAPNTIGSQTTTGSLSFTMSSSGGTFSGIGLFSGTFAAVEIKNNTIGGINISGSSTEVRGINVESSISATGCVISGNTVANLTSTSTLDGIYSNSTSNTIARNFERNFVHSLSTTSANTSTAINGIRIAGGLVTVQNNMVRLGLDSAGNSITAGYAFSGINFSGAANSAFYHNTVWIGGEGVTSSSSNSAALNTQTTNTREAKNNLLVNVRSNAAGASTPTHAAALFSSTTGLTSDYNLFLASGVGGALVRRDSTNYATLSAWRSASGQDANSLAPSSAVAINLINPGGDISAVNLHVQSPTTIESAGVDVGVTDDFDGAIRADLTPTDIGADAGAFAPVDTTPPAFDFSAAQRPNLLSPALNNVAITDAGTGVATVSDTRPRVYYKRTTDNNALGDNTCATNGWKYAVAAGSGGSPFSFTLDYSLLFGCNGVDASTIIEYFVVAQDMALPPNVGSSSGSFASQPASVDLPPAAFPIGGAPSSTPAPFVWQGDDAVDPTNWHVGANWDAGLVPGNQNAAVIPLTTNRPVVWVGNVEVAYLTVQASGMLTINPGLTLNINRKLAHYGQIAGAGSVVVQDMDWYRGTLNNVQATVNGTLRLLGADKKYVYASTLTVAPGASAIWETTGNLACYGTSTAPGLIEVQGTWDFRTDADIDDYYIGTSDVRGTFRIAPGGLVQKTAGTGQTFVSIHNDNDGTVEIHSGELKLSGRQLATDVSDGVYLIKTGATLALTRGLVNYSHNIGPSGAIRDFSPADHGNVVFEYGSGAGVTVVDGEYDISGSTTALSATSSNHILNNIKSLGFVNLPADNNASLTLNGVGKTFDHLFDIENHTGGVLTVNFATFNVGTAADPKNYTQSCSHGLCTWAGSGIAQVWGTTSWLDGYIRGANRATDKFITRGPAILDHNTLKVLDNRTFETNAGLTFKNGEIRVYSATIHNSATGRWDFQCDCDIIEPTTNDSVFDNDGVLGKSVGSMAGVSEFETILNNRHLVDLRQGVFNFRDNLGGTSPGDFAVNEGTLLRLHGNHLISGRVCGNDNGAVDCDPSAVTGNVEVWDSGNTHFSGLYHITAGTTVMGCCFNKTTWDIVPQSLGPLLVMDAADAYFTVGPVATAYDVTLRDGGIMGLNFPDQATTFTVNGVYRQLADGTGSTEREGIGTLVIAGPGPHQWTGGRWDSYGKTVLSPGAALAIETNVEAVLLYAHTFENRSDVTYSGANNLGVASFGTGPTTIDNYGAWDIQTDADMDAGFSTGQNTLNNYGSFRKTAGSGETIVLADVNNKSGGVFAVDVGSIRLQYNDLVNDRGGTVILGLDRWLYVDNTVTNNGKIEDTQSSTADEFARITNPLGLYVKYRGVLIESPADMGQTTVTVWGNQHCGIATPSLANHPFGGTGKDASDTVLRCYEITPTTPQTADVTFFYLANTGTPPLPSHSPDERNGNGDPYAWHHNSLQSRWDIEDRSARDNGNNGYRWVKATGVDQYSPFALLDNSTLAVTLADFSALQVNDAILVTWETVSELNNRGFNLYRGTSEAGPDIQLNETLIPSQSQGNPSGFIYTWEDRRDLAPGTTYFYWLDDVDLAGTVTRHGPVSATYQGPTAVTLSQLQAESATPATTLSGWAALGGALALVASLRKRSNA